MLTVVEHSIASRIADEWRAGIARLKGAELTLYSDHTNEKSPFAEFGMARPLPHLHIGHFRRMAWLMRSINSWYF